MPMWPAGTRALQSATAVGAPPGDSRRAIGAVVARFVHTEEVTGSNPVSPTSVDKGQWPVPDKEPSSCPLRLRSLRMDEVVICRSADGETVAEADLGETSLTLSEILDAARAAGAA